MSIHIVFGKLGAYKSFYSIMSAYILAEVTGYGLAANFPLEGAIMIRDYKHLMSLKRFIVILDEVEMFMNSRNYQSKENKAIAEFGLRARKQMLEILFIAPRLSSIDVNVRDICDFFHYMEHRGRYVLHEVYEKHMLQEDLSYLGSNLIDTDKFKMFYGCFDTKAIPVNFMEGASL